MQTTVLLISTILTCVKIHLSMLETGREEVEEEEEEGEGEEEREDLLDLEQVLEILHHLLSPSLTKRKTCKYFCDDFVDCKWM